MTLRARHVPGRHPHKQAALELSIHGTIAQHRSGIARSLQLFGRAANRARPNRSTLQQRHRDWLLVQGLDKELRFREELPACELAFLNSPCLCPLPLAPTGCWMYSNEAAGGRQPGQGRVEAHPRHCGRRWRRLANQCARLSATVCCATPSSGCCAGLPCAGRGEQKPRPRPVCRRRPRPHGAAHGPPPPPPLTRPQTPPPSPRTPSGRSRPPAAPPPSRSRARTAAAAAPAAAPPPWCCWRWCWWRAASHTTGWCCSRRKRLLARRGCPGRTAARWSRARRRRRCPP